MSNKSVRKEILAIDPKADVESLNAGELSELLEKLKKLKADQPSNSDSDEVIIKPPQFTVAPGKSITSKKGILTEGQAVEPKILGEGESGVKAVKNLVESKAINKNWS